MEKSASKTLWNDLLPNLTTWDVNDVNEGPPGKAIRACDGHCNLRGHGWMNPQMFPSEFFPKLIVCDYSCAWPEILLNWLMWSPFIKQISENHTITYVAGQWYLNIKIPYNGIAEVYSMVKCNKSTLLWHRITVLTYLQSNCHWVCACRVCIMHEEIQLSKNKSFM